MAYCQKLKDAIFLCVACMNCVEHAITHMYQVRFASHCLFALIDSCFETSTPSRRLTKAKNYSMSFREFLVAFRSKI